MQTVLCSRSGVHTTSDLQVRTQVSNPTNDFTWTSPPCPDMADQADPTGRDRPVKGEHPVWPGSSARQKPVDIARFRQLDEHQQAGRLQQHRCRFQAKSSPTFDSTPATLTALPEIKRRGPSVLVLGPGASSFLRRSPPATLLLTS